MEYKQSLNSIVAEAHDVAMTHGFYDDIEAALGYLRQHDQSALAAIVKRDFVLAQLAKVDSEVGEAVQAIQRHDINSAELEEELADIVIRVADLAGFLDVDLGRSVHRKMVANRSRPRKHGKIC